MAQVEEFSRVADQFPTIDERKNTKFLFQITDPYLLYYRGGLEILVQVEEKRSSFSAVADQ